jgi:hypothetical protein
LERRPKFADAITVGFELKMRRVRFVGQDRNRSAVLRAERQGIDRTAEWGVRDLQGTNEHVVKAFAIVRIN